MIYGPNTTAVQSIIDRVARMTDDEIQLLDEAGDSTWDSVNDSVRDTGWQTAKDRAANPSLDADNDAALEEAREAAWDSATARAIDAHWGASLGEAWEAAKAAARDAGKDADWGEGLSPGLSPAWATILAAITYDLATIEGPYTIFQRDLLMAPWVSVYGMPEGLIEGAAT